MNRTTNEVIKSFIQDIRQDPFYQEEMQQYEREFGLFRLMFPRIYQRMHQVSSSREDPSIKVSDKPIPLFCRRLS